MKMVYSIFKCKSL